MRDYCYRLVTFLFIFLGGPHSLSRFRFYKNHRNLSMGRKCQRLTNTRTKFLACKYSIACHNTGRYGGNISGWVGGEGAIYLSIIQNCKKWLILAMAIVGRAKYTHTRAQFREDATQGKCVYISPSPQLPSPKLETTRSVINSRMSSEYLNTLDQFPPISAFKTRSASSDMSSYAPATP